MRPTSRCCACILLDEAGYYIPAAWDFFRTGSLIPITTLTNAHPPLPAFTSPCGGKSQVFTPK